MGFSSYVSEVEACQLAGISSSTLNRFVEAGYLDVETENDGLRLYSINELKSVFSIAPAHVPPVKHASEESDEEGGVLHLKLDVAQKESPQPTQELAGEHEKSTGDIKEPTSFHGTTAQKSYYTESCSLDSYAIRATEELDFQKIKQHKNPQPHLKEDSQRDLLHQAEIAKIQKVNEVNELIIQLREKEIEELRQERNWLRQRVERLEEKGDRDQVLLLSETQLMKQMLLQQSERRFSLRGALRWLGLQQEEPKVFVDRLT